MSFHGDFSPFRRLSDNKLNHFHSSCSSPFSLAWSVSTCDAQANVLASSLSLILFVFMPLKNLRDFFIKMQNSYKYYSLPVNRQDKSLGLSLFFTPLPSAGRVNQRLKSNTIWQTDIIHISELGSLKYIPITIYTFSNMIVASSHEDKTTSDVMNNVLYLFFLGFYTTRN